MTTPTSRNATLFEEHRALVRMCDDLKNRAESGDWRLCEEIWSDFSWRLEEHMRLEETELFPRYAALGGSHVGIVKDLVGDHASFRATLAQMGVNVELHLLRKTDVDRLVERLDLHAQRENETLYPWARSIRLTAAPLSSPRTPLPTGG